MKTFLITLLGLFVFTNVYAQEKSPRELLKLHEGDYDVLDSRQSQLCAPGTFEWIITKDANVLALKPRNFFAPFDFDGKPQIEPMDSSCVATVTSRVDAKNDGQHLFFDEKQRCADVTLEAHHEVIVRGDRVIYRQSRTSTNPKKGSPLKIECQFQRVNSTKI